MAPYPLGTVVRHLQGDGTIQDVNVDGTVYRIQWGDGCSVEWPHDLVTQHLKDNKQVSAATSTPQRQRRAPAAVVTPSSAEKNDSDEKEKDTNRVSAIDGLHEQQKRHSAARQSNKSSKTTHPTGTDTPPAVVRRSARVRVAASSTSPEKTKRTLYTAADEQEVECTPDPPKRRRTLSCSTMKMKRKKADNSLIGRRIRKFFRGYGWFWGTIVSIDTVITGFDKEEEMCVVQYHDGDQEDMTQTEVEEYLVPLRSMHGARMFDHVSNLNDDNAEPEEEENIGSDAYSEEEEEEEEDAYEETNEKGGDEEEELLVFDNEDDEEEKESTLEKTNDDNNPMDMHETNSKGPKTATDVSQQHPLIQEARKEDRKPPPRKRQAQRTTRTSRKQRKKPSPKGSSFSSTTSIAARGLPAGCRAVGRGGFEIRAVHKAIPPLLTPERIKKAVALLHKDRQYDAAARLLHCPDLGPGVAVLIRAACERLRLAVPAVVKGSEVLSERSRMRLEEGTVGVDGALPGKFVIVRAGWDEKTEGPVCPDELVGQEFSSGDEFHEQLGERLLATYAMEVVPDESFDSLNVVKERLEAAGILHVAHKSPFLVQVHWKGGDTLPVGSWGVYSKESVCDQCCDMQWALVEGGSRDAPAVVVGVSSGLLTSGISDDDGSTSESYQRQASVTVVPPLSNEVASIRLPASQLQKAIRRNFCSPAPLLEACRALCVNGPRGGTFHMLKGIWSSMLEDASPFDPPDDHSLLGFEELLLLSLVAKVDSSWQLPPELMRKVVATAIRTQQQPANFSSISKAEDDSESWRLLKGDTRQTKLQNSITIMNAAIGGKIIRRSEVTKASPVDSRELELSQSVLAPEYRSPQANEKIRKLDAECRLASYDCSVSPASLLVLQATLPHPPRDWKKHSVRAIATHVKKLITNVNARMPELHRLTRIAAWGNNSNVEEMAEMANRTMCAMREYNSAREVVTSTGTLSAGEHEIIDCFEAVQKWREEEGSMKQFEVVENGDGTNCEGPSAKFIRAHIGPEPTEHDGRIAFLLCFAMAEEIEVEPSEGKREVVNVLFCGDPNEPLLVQRIGKAREEAAIAQTGPAGSSGAKAVPSLGYVDSSSSEENRLLVETAKREVASRWGGGRVVSLPLPPPGLQWKIPGSIAGKEEEAERKVVVSASIDDIGMWRFQVAGVSIPPFDARKVISPCKLDANTHKNMPLPPEHEIHVRRALYIDPLECPRSLLDSLHKLHAAAAVLRLDEDGADEGLVYDWLPIAATSTLSAAVWRDAILAVKTRERDEVALGPVLSDGETKRDMTEGCLLRIFHVLEYFYPTALIKTSALKWLVRPRGAGYHHMMDSLDQLSRGEATSVKKSVATAAQATVRRSPRGEGVRCGSDLRPTHGDSGDEYVVDSGNEDSSVESTDLRTKKQRVPLPMVKTTLWPHQEASVEKIVAGVRQGRRGHADASAVGAGKTLTALATMVKLAQYMKESQRKRNGMLVMLPTKALVKEWLLQFAAHTSGFHVVEQRESGQLHSLTYGKSTPPPPIDGSTVVISTLDRVREHPFIRQAAWDFVVIDECLAVQNASAKRCPSAWRQIEVSALGVLMLSATFFRSKFSDLFYMVRMLRGPFPRSIEWLPATINEHIVCQVPETDRSWTMEGFPVKLSESDLQAYREIIGAFKRNQLNNRKPDPRQLFADLESFLRERYSGRNSKKTYAHDSVMADAFCRACKKLIKDGHRPLVFADTSDEASHILRVLCRNNLEAKMWSDIARGGSRDEERTNRVIVAVKSVEGQGINMQGYADSIVCRPTPGDHLEQMKGRVDRPGQSSKELVLLIVMAEHTIEEAKFANIQLAGNFFREYIAPVAQRVSLVLHFLLLTPPCQYREKIDLEATLAVSDTGRHLQPGTVIGAWRKQLEAAGGTGSFAPIVSEVETPQVNGNNKMKDKGRREVQSSASSAKCKSDPEDHHDEIKMAPRNKVLRNKQDPAAVREAKRRAKDGLASDEVRQWLFPPKGPKATGLALASPLRFSDASPPIVLNRETVRDAVNQLSRDPKLAAVIRRVGEDGLFQTCGSYSPPTQATFFDHCIRAITFTMVSVDAGNAFLRRLAMKIGVCLENMTRKDRDTALHKAVCDMQEAGTHLTLTTDSLLKGLLSGSTKNIVFTPDMLKALTETCIIVKGKRTGYPHLCGATYPCGKHDDWGKFLAMAREQGSGNSAEAVSAGYSISKAEFIVLLVQDFESGKISAEKLSKASDREAAAMLAKIKGFGDWCVGQVLIHLLRRADIMLYGDVTIRNTLNDLYEINHNDTSETHLHRTADFPDNRQNRNLMDAVAKENNWHPYRSVVGMLMYHLQEENLVLL